jgi:hypothetical protein
MQALLACTPAEAQACHARSPHWQPSLANGPCGRTTCMSLPQPNDSGPIWCKFQAIFSRTQSHNSASERVVLKTIRPGCVTCWLTSFHLMFILVYYYITFLSM